MSPHRSPAVLAVLMTAPDADTGERIGAQLVRERLAACANVVPGVVSVYRWEGQVQRDSEVLVILKTTVDRVDALKDRAVALHPYEVPEVIALPVTAGHAPYLEWVRLEATG